MIANEKEERGQEGDRNGTEKNGERKETKSRTSFIPSSFSTSFSFCPFPSYTYLRKEGRKEGRKDEEKRTNKGRKEGRKDGRKDGRKEGRKTTKEREKVGRSKERADNAYKA